MWHLLPVPDGLEPCTVPVAGVAEGENDVSTEVVGEPPAAADN
jgi:hypothetical protein